MGRPKKKTRKPQPKPKSIPVLADSTKGSEWLHQMAEASFRDEVLKDLFAHMKVEGKIGDFVNVHGRNEHGIDWIIEEYGEFANRLVGIQAKSRSITKQGNSQSDDVHKVKNQCESAYDNRFVWHGNDARLDDVQLWTSAHITSDAETELMAPYSKHKILVVKEEKVFSLIEKYCPSLVAKIPGLAEAGYISHMANPDPLQIKLLGIQLNPKKHFLEPRFSLNTNLESRLFFDSRTRKMREERPIYLDDIIQSESHSFIVGPELSGKTYILQRICCQVASLGHLPVYIDAVTQCEKMPKSISELLVKYLNWYPLRVLENEETLNRTVYLLLDNADGLTIEQIDQLRDTAHKKIVIILAGERSRSLKGFKNYFISGVKDGAVHKFVRSLDIDQVEGTALADRTVHYIGRTFGTSGLPMNTFTVSVMLAECQVAQTRLATPTMGRLIERFVEGQLGSHADSLLVDFETKYQFLTNIGGSNKPTFTAVGFRRRLAKFISDHGHPHELNSFEKDLFESGLLERDSKMNLIKWSHPVFREYFWARNLVREKKFNVISKRLLHSSALSVAAITGSQMGDAHAVLVNISADIDAMAWMKKSKNKRSVARDILSEELLPNDSEEEALLNQIEDEANQSNLDIQKKPQSDPSIPMPDGVKKALSQYAKLFVEEKHYLVANIAALLLNARSLSREDKENAVLCILKSNAQVTTHISEILRKVIEGKISPLKQDILSRFLGLMLNDSMIGDPFLIDIFRGLLRATVLPEEKLAFIDLLVACNGTTPNSYVKILKQHMEVVDVVAVYIRLMNTYYFRFHKGKENAQLREAMKEVRKLAKGFSLPVVA